MNDVPQLQEEDRRILRALFIANEAQRPSVRAFRLDHRNSRKIIDRLIDWKFIQDDRDHYRLSLRGLQETDLARARYYIELFNEAIPALQTAYARNEKGLCTKADLIQLMNLSHPVDERALELALSYLLPEVRGGATTGWSWDAEGRFLHVGLGEPILDLEPFPETPDKTTTRRDDSRSKAESMANQVSSSGVRIFISHSSRDRVLVELLVDLLVAAIRIPKADIRCTSVPGCRLPAGADAQGVLAEDIRASEVFVALLTEASAEASFVLFELGARWGQRRPIIPVLGPGAGFDLLPSPVKQIHTLKTTEETDLMQLVREVAEALGVAAEPTEAYHRALRALATHPPVPPK